MELVTNGEIWPAVLQNGLRHLQISLHHGVDERRLADLVDGVGVRPALLHQDGGRARVPVDGRQVQGRLLAPGLSGVGVGAVAQQQVGDLGAGAVLRAVLLGRRWLVLSVLFFPIFILI